MPGKRIAMRQIRDVLSLRLEARLSIRQIKASTKVSVGAIQKLLSQAESLGLIWPLPPALDDAELARMFYPGTDTTATRRFQLPDWPAMHQELKRKGMTKQLLGEEYTERYPNRCYSYSQFCERYSRWRKQQKRSMRQLHKAGEKCVHRLRRTDGADHRCTHRGGQRRTGICRRPRRLQLHLRRSHPDTIIARLAAKPCASLHVLCRQPPRCGSPTTCAAPSTRPVDTIPTSTQAINKSLNAGS